MYTFCTHILVEELHYKIPVQNWNDSCVSMFSMYGLRRVNMVNLISPHPWETPTTRDQGMVPGTVGNI